MVTLRFYCFRNVCESYTNNVVKLSEAKNVTVSVYSSSTVAMDRSSNFLMALV